ncbi:hypothetical protein [Plantactinospora endophytica]|uniref:hypothetical protein n=1 Tax=Plantactinospora endophytica TaxID=673535 RepID=UPI001942C82A|nr:hypothetical protein [Plantactinospora endophytica]
MDEAYRRLDDRWTAPPPEPPEPHLVDPVYPALRALDEAHSVVLLEGPYDVAEHADLVVASVGDEYRSQRQVLGTHQGALDSAAVLDSAAHRAAISARTLHRANFIEAARKAIGGHLTSR